MDLAIVHDRHFHQPALPESAPAQAGRIALRRDADLDVEMVALLIAGPEPTLHHDQGKVAGRQHGVGVAHAANLHLFQQGCPVRRRARIAARPVQSSHQADGLNALRCQRGQGRHRDVANHPRRVLFRVRIVRTLRTHCPVPPGAAPKAQRNRTRCQQDEVTAFHASCASLPLTPMTADNSDLPRRGQEKDAVGLRFNPASGPRVAKSTGRKDAAGGKNGKAAPRGERLAGDLPRSVVCRLKRPP